MRVLRGRCLLNVIVCKPAKDLAVGLAGFGDEDVLAVLVGFHEGFGFAEGGVSGDECEGVADLLAAGRIEEVLECGVCDRGRGRHWGYLVGEVRVEGLAVDDEDDDTSGSHERKTEVRLDAVECCPEFGERGGEGLVVVLDFEGLDVAGEDGHGEGGRREFLAEVQTGLLGGGLEGVAAVVEGEDGADPGADDGEDDDQDAFGGLELVITFHVGGERGPNENDDAAGGQGDKEETEPHDDSREAVLKRWRIGRRRLGLGGGLAAEGFDGFANSGHGVRMGLMGVRGRKGNERGERAGFQNVKLETSRGGGLGSVVGRYQKFRFEISECQT